MLAEPTRGIRGLQRRRRMGTSKCPTQGWPIWPWIGRALVALVALVAFIKLES